ncbi:MAG: YgjV family protein [Chitinophagaceae bacterium]|nr:YgjV family protein [Bacteroidota bacterium]MCC6257237.1 YgjV family protein [Chitinophagaceae bacterium]MCW5916127.1 YgjV family protein [Ferruginibacter sp.]
MIVTIAIWLGYLASLCLIISLIVTTDIKFRFYNLLGCLFFVIYALLLSAWPVFITNAILLCINIYYLYQINTRQEKFDIIEFGAGNPLAQKFLDYYKEDIATYYPGFNPSQLNGSINFIILRDLTVANIFSAGLQQNGEATVYLNYTAKPYRDFKVGTFLFNKEKNFLVSKGVSKLLYKSMEHRGHIRFLERMGFSRIANDTLQGYELNLQR